MSAALTAAHFRAFGVPATFEHPETGEVREGLRVIEEPAAAVHPTAEGGGAAVRKPSLSVQAADWPDKPTGWRVRLGGSASRWEIVSAQPVGGGLEVPDEWLCTLRKV